MEGRELLTKILIKLKQTGVNNVLCSQNLKSTFLSEIALKTNMNLVYYLDTRTVTYAAIGMSAETAEPIAVLSNCDNDSRSLAPGLTEAYYRQLPIFAILLQSDFSLDYSKIIRDTGIKSLFISSETIGLIDNSIKDTIVKKLPMYICLQASDICNNNVYSSIELDKLISRLNSDFYVIISHHINTIYKNTKSKVRINNGAYGSDGIISTVLGASLANRRKKYIAILLESEFIHDINSLGCRHYSDKIGLIIVKDSGLYKDLVLSTCSSFGIKILDKIEDIESCDKSFIYMLNF